MSFTLTHQLLSMAEMRSVCRHKKNLPQKIVPKIPPIKLSFQLRIRSQIGFLGCIRKHSLQVWGEGSKITQLSGVTAMEQVALPNLELSQKSHLDDEKIFENCMEKPNKGMSEKTNSCVSTSTEITTQQDIQGFFTALVQAYMTNC